MCVYTVHTINNNIIMYNIPLRPHSWCGGSHPGGGSPLTCDWNGGSGGGGGQKEEDEETWSFSLSSLSTGHHTG